MMSYDDNIGPDMIRHYAATYLDLCCLHIQLSRAQMGKTQYTFFEFVTFHVDHISHSRDEEVIQSQVFGRVCVTEVKD